MTDTVEKKPSISDDQEGKKRFFARIKQWITSGSFKCILMNIAAYVIILVIFFFVCVPKKYDLGINSIAPETIKATKDVVDEVNTLAEKEKKAADPKNTVYRNTHSLDAAFLELNAIQDYAKLLREADEIPPDKETGKEQPGAGEPEATEETSPKRVYTDEEVEKASALLSILLFTPEQIRFVLEMNPADFDMMKTAIADAVNAELTDAGLIDKLTEEAADKIDISIQKLTNNQNLQAYQIILPEILKCIKPNYVIDQEKTDEERRKAMDSVEPIVYQQGRTIVREGELIEEYQLSMLRSLGLLNNQSINYSLYQGSALAVLAAIICLLMSLKLLQADILTDVRKMAVILIVLILSVGMTALAHLLPSQFVIPLTMGTILGTVLIGYKAGICVTFSLSIIIAALTSGNASSTFFDVVILMSMTISESILAIWFLKERPQRVRVLLAGPLSVSIGFIVILGIRWLTSSISFDVITAGAWSLAGGALSGALAVAFQPALEQIFRLATPSRLLELTNPNQPLMKRLMIEAPGTYHHSIIVANLAEAAADKIGANPYLARAGAYYHDIGKLKRPGYFKENQNGDNPHERTDPYISAAILISHTMDGMLMAQKEHMPQEVLNIILQHHGVTPVMFFYHKALQLSNGTHVDIDEFRYSGPKPNTKEAAIVMLADTIEAAVRSMKEPTPKGIDQFIERLVRGKLEDGQLSESPLSLSDIDKICDAFSGILRGVYHERIEYPTVPQYSGKMNMPVETVEKKDVNSASASDHPAAASSAQNESPAETKKTKAEADSEKGREDSSNEA